MCADETGCDWEKVTLCAFAEASFELKANMKFLDCMDSHKLPLFYDPSVPQACAQASNLGWKNISACFSGRQGTALITGAQQEVIRKIGRGSFSLPLVQVDGQQVCSGKVCSYDVVANSIPKIGRQDAAQARPSVSYFFANV